MDAQCVRPTGVDQRKWDAALCLDRRERTGECFPSMNPRMLRLASAAALFMATLALSSCIYEKPVFTRGFIRPDPAWNGLWQTRAQEGKRQMAAFLPLDGKRSLLHYPATPEGWYFEATSLDLRGRHLMQLKILAGPGVKVPASDADNYTVLWIDPRADGSLGVRALDGGAIVRKGLYPQMLRKHLAAPESDWNKIFGAPMVFTKQ